MLLNLGNPNADQTVTKVDTRLTRVDKTYHCQPPPHSQTTAKHGKTANPTTILSTPLSTPAVNPSGTSRTNPNTAAAHAQRPTAMLDRESPVRRGQGLGPVHTSVISAQE